MSWQPFCSGIRTVSWSTEKEEKALRKKKGRMGCEKSLFLSLLDFVCFILVGAHLCAGLSLLDVFDMVSN